MNLMMRLIDELIGHNWANGWKPLFIEAKPPWELEMEVRDCTRCGAREFRSLTTPSKDQDHE